MASKRAISKVKTVAEGELASFAVGVPDLFTIVRDKKAELSGVQRRVAVLLLEHPQWFVRASVSDIAARLHVSAPTVVRFARKIGFEGLRDLKLKLAGAMALRELADNRRTVAPHDADGAVGVLAERLTVVLADWRRQTDRASLEQAAEAILRARQIMCFGANAFSNLLAQRLHGGLYQLGYGAHSLSDASYQFAAVTTLTKDDVLIVISLDGRQPTLLSVVELAKLRGVFVIAIAGGGAGLAEKSDVLVTIDASSAPPMLQDVGASLLQTITVEALVILVGIRRAGASLAGG